MRKLEKELLDIMFGNNKEITIEKGNVKITTMCQSTLKTVLMCAKYDENEFAALIHSLIALEQIGELFCDDDNRANADNNGIVKALRKFLPHLDDRQQQGIKHLRHSLAHNFGLSTNKYKYILTNSEDITSLIRKPKQEWNGNFTYKSIIDAANTKLTDDTSFIVYVSNLIHQVQNIYETLKQKHQKDELHFVGNNKQRASQTDLARIACTYFVYNFNNE